ncbi:hypothetical protein FKV24_005775 [Lysobacter maris]|uniref:Uncharacterized protein n=1 Tax=Marilutibacter maris TaxID=1605891 RepID=A0A508AZG0_9GAMM|nr:hypothetical protein [Lysobacter maris]KAB8194406.1 hypothetical protein FKV24_005775 [Lysobacter maris]
MKRIVQVACLILFFFLLTGCEDTGKKHEWSILQAYEYQNRDLDLSSGTIVKIHEDYCLLGVVSSSNRPQRIWVLMNPKFEPFLKRVPDEPVAITRAEYDGLPKRCRSNKRVESVIVR